MMRVHISDFARQQILETASYIQREFGKRYRDNFMQKVRETKLLLAANPQLGPMEPSLSMLPKTYRSIVVARLNKMVYYIEDDVIEVSDFLELSAESREIVRQDKVVSLHFLKYEIHHRERTAL